MTFEDNGCASCRGRSPSPVSSPEPFRRAAARDCCRPIRRCHLKSPIRRYRRSPIRICPEPVVRYCRYPRSLCVKKDIPSVCCSSCSLYGKYGKN